MHYGPTVRSLIGVLHEVMTWDKPRQELALLSLGKVLDLAVETGENLTMHDIRLEMFEHMDRLKGRMTVDMEG